ncbi:hypothetical protein RKD55_004030 [Rossellomorea marisflavi]
MGSVSFRCRGLLSAGRSQAPSAAMHSLVLDMGLEGEGLHHDILLIVLRMVLSIPILSKGAGRWGLFLFAAGACFPRGVLVPAGSRFSSYQESSAFRCNALFGSGYEIGRGEIASRHPACCIEDGAFFPLFFIRNRWNGVRSFSLDLPSLFLCLRCGKLKSLCVCGGFLVGGSMLFFGTLLRV